MNTNRHETSIDAFFALIRAGLWEDVGANLDLNLIGKVDWEKVYQLAEEQSVVGLALAGIEQFKKANVLEASGTSEQVRASLALDQELLLQLIGEVQMIEQTNKTMNQFIEKLIEKMREVGIYILLVKGQGIAQCYERPLWRASGDVDFFLCNDNYEKAKRFLLPLSSGNKPERLYSKEMGMSIDPWYVEVHGTLRTGLSTRIDKAIDSVQNDVFFGGSVRSWKNGNTQVFLPAPDCDVFFVFTHFVKHFYKEGGVSIRQLCDWCRLLWTYKDSLNRELLESRIRKAGLMSEWKALAALAVEFLGMPVTAMPLYSSDMKWKKKAKRIVAFILKGGGWRKIKDTISVGKIFPLSTLRYLPGILLSVNWLKIKERLLGQVSI